MAPPIAAPTISARRGGASVDVLVFGALLAAFYAVIRIGHTWFGPIAAKTEISLHPSALPRYAGFSLLRMAAAYAISLAFSLVYGYVAAKSKRAERLMVPLLDVLQSIPVLSFLPGVMLAMIALFPERQLGLELGSVLLIFTGQAWNMAFSFYGSLKVIPQDLREATVLYQFSRWQTFRQLELPYATIGLVWNSMMSVAGGWFFLMACEMFVLGSSDFRLPGLGSYLQTAASAGNTSAILWGLGTMVGIIVAIDQLIWRPAIAWADKFKMEQVESSNVPRSAVLGMLRSSRGINWLQERITNPIGEHLNGFLARREAAHAGNRQSGGRLWIGRTVFVLALLGIGYGVAQSVILLLGLTRAEAGGLLSGALATFLRVNAALLIGALWTIPAGVAIGFNPRLSRIAQPLVQIAASVPATALFPVILLLLIDIGGGLSMAAIVLMILGTQWYILFNVIAGAMAIPQDLKEAAGIFRFGQLARWRLLILPGIFPGLVTGLITATGGAWNASIIAEYFHFRERTLSTTGLGAVISRATEEGNFHSVLAATILMVAIVVTINRLVWKRLYRLAGTRFKLET